MKTLADFKKAVTIGSQWVVTRHQGKFTGERDAQGRAIYSAVVMPPREVSIVQTNSFALKTTNTDGKVVDSWLQFPKAKDVKFLSEDSIEIYEGDLLCLTYTKLV